MLAWVVATRGLACHHGGHVILRRPARVASCTLGTACPYKLRGLCWCRHVDVLPRRVDAATAAPNQRVVETLVSLIDALQELLTTNKVLPQERVQWRTADVPVPFPEEVSERIVKPWVPVPHVTEMIVLIDQGGPVPQAMDEIARCFSGLSRNSGMFLHHGFKVLPQQRVLRRIVSKMPVPRFLEEIVGPIQPVPLE